MAGTEKEKNENVDATTAISIIMVGSLVEVTERRLSARDDDLIITRWRGRVAYVDDEILRVRREPNELEEHGPGVRQPGPTEPWEQAIGLPNELAAPVVERYVRRASCPADTRGTISIAVVGDGILPQ